MYEHAVAVNNLRPCDCFALYVYGLANWRRRTCLRKTCGSKRLPRRVEKKKRKKTNAKPTLQNIFKDDFTPLLKVPWTHPHRHLDSNGPFGVLLVCISWVCHVRHDTALGKDVLHLLLDFETNSTWFVSLRKLCKKFNTSLYCRHQAMW